MSVSLRVSTTPNKRHSGSGSASLDPATATTQRTIRPEDAEELVLDAAVRHCLLALSMTTGVPVYELTPGHLEAIGRSAGVARTDVMVTVYRDRSVRFKMEDAELTDDSVAASIAEFVLSTGRTW